MPTFFKFFSILCEAEPVYGTLTEDWYSVLSSALRGIFEAEEFEKKA